MHGIFLGFSAVDQAVASLIDANVVFCRCNLDAPAAKLCSQDCRMQAHGSVHVVIFPGLSCCPEMSALPVKVHDRCRLTSFAQKWLCSQMHCNVQAHNAFCAIRPPGHHSGPRGVVGSVNEPHGSHGFCLLNNLAIGAAYSLNVHRSCMSQLHVARLDS